MLIFRSITLLFAIGAFISGCSSLAKKEPFQIYAPKTDCVSCKKQEMWGFVKQRIHRHNKIVYFASFMPKTTSSKQFEGIGLCYGTAIDTIKSGATHFRILDNEEWGDWVTVSTPKTITTDIFGTMSIHEGGRQRINRHQSGMWWTNHYYETGSPDCETFLPVCSNQHKFDIQNCPYEGGDLKRETEEKRAILSCVMKSNPRLLLHDVYYEEAGCSHQDPNRWIPADDVIKKYGVIFQLDE